MTKKILNEIGLHTKMCGLMIGVFLTVLLSRSSNYWKLLLFRNGILLMILIICVWQKLSALFFDLRNSIIFIYFA